MKKRIYFKLAGRIQSQHKDLIDYPPDGYEFIAGKSAYKGDIIASDFFLYKTRRFWENLLPTNLTKARIDRYLKKIPDKIDLIYAYNNLVFNKTPWVVLVEWGNILIGRNIKHFRKYKPMVEDVLSSEYCKGVIVWTDWAKKSIILNYDCTGFAHKIYLIPKAVSRKNFIKNFDDTKIKLLYVGSSNINMQFDLKGGKEALEVFSILNQKYRSSNLEFVIRAKIPDHIKARYSQILSMKNVRVIEDVVPWETIEHEFKTADIFLYPTHELNNTVILEAMSYELPVVTTEIGSTGRIEDGETGFIVREKNIPYFFYNKDVSFIRSGATPQRQEFLRAIQSKVDPEVIQKIAETTSTLIDNPTLRKRVGKTARLKIEEGDYSTENRNKNLKSIFDKATAN